MSRLRFVFGGAAAIVTVLVAYAGCAQNAGEPSCERNSDCTRAYCLDGKCRQDCIDSELDCPKGYTCNAIGKCEYGPGSGGSGAEGGGPSSGGAGPGGGDVSSSTTTGTPASSSSMSGAHRLR